MSVRVWLASRNAGKVREMKALLAPYLEVCPWQRGQPPLESGSSYLENALLKAQAVRAETLDWVLADDSGLEVEALDGRPGVHSARYAEEGASDRENRAKLLAEMAGFSGDARRARFVAVLVLLRLGYPALAVEGSCPGTIAAAEQGEGGFGYDPIFVPDELSVTFAAASDLEKAAVSHRGRAARQLLHELQLGGVFDPGSRAG